MIQLFKRGCSHVFPGQDFLLLHLSKKELEKIADHMDY